MVEALHSVDEGSCKGEGICVEVCPKGVIEIHEGHARTVLTRVDNCIRCLQCAAVCPNESMSFLDSAAGALLPQRKWSFSHEDFNGFLDARRSVRVFSDKPVARELVDKVIETAASAPPGFPPTCTEVVVLDRKEDIDHLAAELRRGYGKLLEMFGNPIARTVIRVKRGAEMLHALKTHVIPIIREDNAWFERNGMDRYLYGAPVVMLFHSSRWVAGYQETVLIAATYAMLGAHALGLGATLLSIVPPVFNNMGQELRPRFGIPEDNRVIIAMVLGHPKYKFRKAVRRSLKSVRYTSDGGSPKPA